ncbi:protein DBF4 homolog B [Cottoperca gobio]|uniref:Protein DBF4 homolog B n=1 Tax=Cottoperca gobio TaxID=56716 RepID=A0A6J2RR87_COTGO|nr:protein DBF4 homolog B-like [Cottoperca gobio]
MQRASILSSDKRRPGTPRPMACGSRGKALLEKAIRNNERLLGSSVLNNARSWGVKILFVDDVLLYLKHLTRESCSASHKRPEKTNTKQQGAHVVKATPLRAPYLKIEDSSRRFKPLNIQSMTLPTLWYSGKFSPFECPAPLFEKQEEPGENKTREKKKVENSVQDKSQTPLSCNPSPLQPPKKNVSYCECCHQPFINIEEHIQYEQHREFALDPSNYSVLDQLVAEMLPGFNPNPAEQSEEALNRPPTPLPICELEPLTDAEAEDAVQSLHRGSSFNIHISSPTRGPLSSGPASPPLGVQCIIPNPLATPPEDIQPFTTNS